MGGFFSVPDNPFKDMSLGKKGSNFIRGAISGSGISSPKKVRVQVSTGPFGIGRATQTRYVSSAPRSAAGVLGDLAGHLISRRGRKSTNDLFSTNLKKK